MASLLRELESKPADHSFSPATDKPLTDPSVADINACPKCGSAMARRTASHGQFAGHDFLGCTRYPACRGVRQIAAMASNSLRS